jgi:hypothetical protein
MKLADRFKNTFLLNDKYKTDSEAVIIACYFNPQRNPYRLIAFREFYNSIKHLNHYIVECVIGDTKPELLDEFPSLNISRVYTDDLLWHKETLLNNIVTWLPKELKYVFWVDTDVIFTNKNWLVEATQKLRDGVNLIQPFEYCVHLNQDQTEPQFNLRLEKIYASDAKKRHIKLWKSFGANHVLGNSGNQNYDVHGHVGFAWGARREVLDAVPLYDRALIGGADHIIAHAGAGQIGHTCITKSFTDDIEAVNEWSRKFFAVVKGKIEYVEGDLYHIWHGDIEKREYLKRIQDFTPQTKTITEKDKNGLYVAKNGEGEYMKKYFDKREVKDTTLTNRVKVSKTEYNTRRADLVQQYPDRDGSFINSMMWGYIMDDGLMGGMMGGNMMGGMIGDMLNDTPSVTQQLDTMLDDNRPVSDQLDSMLHSPTDTTDYTTSNNFS